MPRLKLRKTEAQEEGPSAEWAIPLDSDKVGSLLLSKAVYDHVPFECNSKYAPGYWCIYHQAGHYNEQDGVWVRYGEWVRKRTLPHSTQVETFLQQCMEALLCVDITPSEKIALKLHDQQFATRKEALHALEAALMIEEDAQ